MHSHALFIQEQKLSMCTTACPKFYISPNQTCSRLVRILGAVLLVRIMIFYYNIQIFTNFHLLLDACYRQGFRLTTSHDVTEQSGAICRLLSERLEAKITENHDPESH